MFQDATFGGAKPHQLHLMMNHDETMRIQLTMLPD
jgi:hypothetical protein